MFMRKEAIEAVTRQVLGDYGKKYAPIAEPPVPVCEIAESLLGLRLDYDDLEKRWGRGVLGAINFESRTVYINTALDPIENEREEGRHNFTLAHEIGHWTLHRCDFLAPDVFQFHEAGPQIMCRTAQKKEPREWQADQFASFLLMPRPMVQKVWRERHGNLVMDVGSVDSFKQGNDLRATMKDYYLLVKDFAQIFAVSGQAMRIRLAELGCASEGNK
jgi:Zn-dependent peptidase ImmA (M78 family)